MPKNTVAGSLDHPSQLQITATSFQNKIGKLPLYEQIYEGYGFNHDTVGGNQYIQGFNGDPADSGSGTCRRTARPVPTSTTSTNPPQLLTARSIRRFGIRSLGFNLFTPSIKLNQPASPYRDLLFQRKLNKQRQWNSLPHYIDTTTTSTDASAGSSPGRSITYLGYQILNVGDHYINGGYQQCQPVGTPFCPVSFTSFRGVSTLRTTSLGINVVPQSRIQLLAAGAPSRRLSDSGARPLRVAAEQHHRPAALYVVLRAGALRRDRRRTVQSLAARAARRFANLLLVWQPLSHAVLAAKLRRSVASDMTRRLLSRRRSPCCAIALVAAGPSDRRERAAARISRRFRLLHDRRRISRGADIVIRDAKTGAATAIRPAPRIWARATFDADRDGDGAGAIARLRFRRKAASPTSRDSRSRSRRRFPIRILLAVRTHAGAGRTGVRRGATFFGPTRARDVHRAGAAEYAVHRRASTSRPTRAAGTRKRFRWIASTHCTTRSRAASTRERSSAISTIGDRFQSEEIAQNGLARAPRNLVVPDADVRTMHDTVYAWRDSVPGSRQPAATADHADAVQSGPVPEPAHLSAAAAAAG